MSKSLFLVKHASPWIPDTPFQSYRRFETANYPDTLEIYLGSSREASEKEGSHRLE